MMDDFFVATGMTPADLRTCIMSAIGMTTFMVVALLFNYFRRVMPSAARLVRRTYVRTRYGRPPTPPPALEPLSARCLALLKLLVTGPHWSIDSTGMSREIPSTTPGVKSKFRISGYNHGMPTINPVWNAQLDLVDALVGLTPHEQNILRTAFENLVTNQYMWLADQKIGVKSDPKHEFAPLELAIPGWPTPRAQEAIMACYHTPSPDKEVKVKLTSNSAKGSAPLAALVEFLTTPDEDIVKKMFRINENQRSTTVDGYKHYVNIAADFDGIKVSRCIFLGYFKVASAAVETIEMIAEGGYLYISTLTPSVPSYPTFVKWK